LESGQSRLITDRRIHHFNDAFKTLFYKRDDQLLMELSLSFPVVGA
jgi:hypothetical protein